MAFDPSHLPKAPRAEECVTIETDAGPFDLNLRVRSGTTGSYHQQEIEETLVQMYIVDQVPVCAMADAPIPVSRKLCKFVSYLLATEAPPADADIETWKPWDAVRWFILADRAPEAFETAIEFWAYLTFKANGTLAAEMTFAQFQEEPKPTVDAESEHGPLGSEEDLAKNGSGADEE